MVMTSGLVKLELGRSSMKVKATNHRDPWVDLEIMTEEVRTEEAEEEDLEPEATSVVAEEMGMAAVTKMAEGDTVEDMVDTEDEVEWGEWEVLAEVEVASEGKGRGATSEEGVAVATRVSDHTNSSINNSEINW